MTARVIHFGPDECYRVQVLRQAGYIVTESHTLDELGLDLQRNEQVEAVFLTEGDARSTTQAAVLARQLSQAPVILFRRSSLDLDEQKFDLVHPWLESPEVWLAKTAVLIASSRALRQRSTCVLTHPAPTDTLP